MDQIILAAVGAAVLVIGALGYFVVTFIRLQTAKLQVQLDQVLANSNENKANLRKIANGSSVHHDPAEQAKFLQEPSVPATPPPKAA